MSQDRREIAIIVALVAVYFTGMTTLAVVVNPKFFFNDGVSAAVWVLIAIVALSGAMATRRR